MTTGAIAKCEIGEGDRAIGNQCDRQKKLICSGLMY